MNRFFNKPFRWAAIYGTMLTLFFAFVLLDAFVIPRAQMRVAAAPSETTAPAATSEASIPETEGTSQITETEGSPGTARDEIPTDPLADAEGQGDSPLASKPIVTATSYRDDHIQITIETLRKADTTFYVADIQISDPSLLKTALAGDTFGRNIKSSTSEMADRVNAIFAINGDYYGSRDAGWVLRNGVLYRDTSSGGEALVIDAAGTLSIADENDADVHAIEGARQILSFGPALVDGGEIAVGVDEEINGKASNSNPRTAIGQAGEGHYIVIVSDGRTRNSAGFSLYQLAQEFTERGCNVAYNLDGGGSSTMILNGRVINTPVGGRGGSGTERKVSDIVYIGY